MNILRRLPLSRLLILCAAVVAIGISVTAIALAVGGGAKPPAEPLSQAVHQALSASPVQGFSAEVKLTNRLLEGANLASAGGNGQGGGEGLASSPLVNGASGRLWVSSDGRARLELQSEKGDTQLVYDGHRAFMYDASTNTVYKLAPRETGGSGSASHTGHVDRLGIAHPEIQRSGSDSREPPSVAKIEEAISEAEKHVKLSAAVPDNVAGQPAYTVRAEPRESGSQIGGAELSFDAAHGLPLRFALYSSSSSSPVIELAAEEASFGPVDSSVFDVQPPAGAKVVEVKPPAHQEHNGKPPRQGGKPGDLSVHGSGVNSIVVAREHGSGAAKDPLAGLPQVTVGASKASELRTELGTVLSFEREGVRYFVAGFQTPASIEAFAQGL